MKNLSESVMTSYLYSVPVINILGYLMTFLEKWFKTILFWDGISFLSKRILEIVSPYALGDKQITDRQRQVGHEKVRWTLILICFTNLNMLKHLVFL